MSIYNTYGEQKTKENTSIITVLPSKVIDLALNGTEDVPGLLNPSAAGAVIFIKLDSEVGIAGITPSLYVLDPDGNKMLFRTEAELTASGMYAYVYYPGVSTGATSINGANITAAANMVIPREYGIRLAKSTGDSDQKFTAQVSLMYLA